MEFLKNKEFDQLVIEFQKGKKSMGSASISKHDLLNLATMHRAILNDIIEDMALAIFDQEKANETNDK